MPAPSPLVRQVGTLLQDTPTRRLLVFVPRPQLGTALQRAVARRYDATAGLQAVPPSPYAEQLAELTLQADGQTKLDAGRQFFLTADVVRQLSSHTQDALTGDQPLTGIVAPLARTFATLRTHGISPDTYRTAAESTPRTEAQATAFAAYEDQLDAHGYYDTAALLRTATRLVSDGVVDCSSLRCAIVNTVGLSGLDKKFVSALARHSPSPLSLLGPHADPETTASPPRPLAAAHFSAASRPETPDATGLGAAVLSPDAALSADAANDLRFWTATGTRREVQAVFEDIVSNERPLDHVELAYTTPEPYLPLIDTLAERYDLPVSLSGGRSVDATRPGQALRGFFDWVADGGPLPTLIELLRAGLITLDRSVQHNGDREDTLDHRRAASLLAQRRYADDPTNHDRSFEAWIHQIEDDLADLDDGADDALSDRRASLRRRRALVQALREEVRTLLSLGHIRTHNDVRLSDFASSAETFLETYGPTPKPPEDEEERTPDQSARNRLLDRLQTLARHETNRPYRPRRLAQHMTSWLPLSPYVRAQRPQPGRIHVVPLESAGFADRDHLYVVGLDAASTGTSLPDDPLLDDEQRAALSADADTTLPQRRRQVDVEDWRTRQALARHTGSLTLTASTYNLSDDEDLFEAPLFLRLKDASQSVRDIADDADDPLVAHYPLAPTRDAMLSDLDRWTSRTRPDPDVVEETISDTVPWIGDGLAAEEARASATYTEYDGLLSPRDYPALNPLAQTRPVTAGRLERYARAPFAYFLRSVLGVSPLEEPALDDTAWLDARGRGAILHETFRRFMADIERRPSRDDEPTLRRHFDEALQTRRDEHPPPSEVVYATTRRELWTDALLFLRVEAARTDDATPFAFELGFGYPPHRRDHQDYEQAPTLQVGDQSFSLRGRVDRIDRSPDGALSLWDYKTGSSRNYDDADLLGDGEHLQWALYAYALETLDQTPVRSAGYFFTSTDEMGKRVAANPSAYRSAVGRRLSQIAEGTAAGAFPVTDADDLRYDFDRLFHDYAARKKQLRRKEWPDDRPAPPSLRDE